MPQDFVEAVKWFRLAAGQGHAGAQFNLGAAHANGQGVPQDLTEAVKWWRLAADQGHAGAQSNLGVMYGNGEGVPQNYVEAIKWCRLAADQVDFYRALYPDDQWYRRLMIVHAFLHISWQTFKAYRHMMKREGYYHSVRKAVTGWRFFFGFAWVAQ